MPKPVRLTLKQRLDLIERVLNDGVSVTDACRAYGVSRFTFYKWKKRYLEAKPGKEAVALSDTTPKGKHHWRRTPARLEKEVLDYVFEFPQASVHKIAQVFDNIGHHGVQTILEKHHLNNLEARLNYSLQTVKRRELSPEEKLQLFEIFEKENESVSHLCLRFGISRFTFYKWYQRYLKAGEGGLKSHRPVGQKHWRITPSNVEKEILNLVIKRPELSTHKIAHKLASVGNHGVQNVLLRNSLNTYDLRLAYSQAHASEVKPVFGLVSSLRKLIGSIPSISAIPPPTSPPTSLKLRGMNWLRGAGPFFRQPKQALSPLIRPFVASLFVSLLIFNFSAYWLNLIAATPSASGKVGLVFASMALLIGGFFFTYSMKYYFTLAIVLSFSRQSEEDPSTSSGRMGGLSIGLQSLISTDKKPMNTDNQRKSALDQRKSVGGTKGLITWIARIFGINTPMNADRKLMNTDNQRGSAHYQRKSVGVGKPVRGGGLLPSLDHITLKRKPFVSIHLPFYNEKKVAQRIMQACASMDYYQDGQAMFEVIVCDDSTDETVDIVNSFAKKWNIKNGWGEKAHLEEEKADGWGMK
ncbi:helix-turn-helix domain-containing protein, partial [Patescibacteria group bacterium]